LIWAAAVVVLTTRWVGRRVTHEVPLRALAVQFWHEISAPRAPKSVSVEFDLSRVRRHRIAAPIPVVGRVVPIESDDGPAPLPQRLTCTWCQVGVHDMCPDDTCACTSRSH